uniref:C-type lectin domain-containing protein n=1 Tax=Lates calcarifer TaxID=8187 RepID=A0A4W6FV47_LATCA
CIMGSGNTKDMKMALLQTSYNNLTNERDQLQVSLYNLHGVLNQLQSRYDTLAREKDQLQKRLESMTKDRNDLQRGCQGWVYFKHSFYYISSTTKFWRDSRNDCLQRGADLMIINSKEEQEFMRRFKQLTWIGLTDRETEGTWRWVDGTLLNTRFIIFVSLFVFGVSSVPCCTILHCMYHGGTNYKSLC